MKFQLENQIVPFRAIPLRSCRKPEYGPSFESMQFLYSFRFSRPAYLKVKFSYCWRLIHKNFQPEEGLRKWYATKKFLSLTSGLRSVFCNDGFRQNFSSVTEARFNLTGSGRRGRTDGTKTERTKKWREQRKKREGTTLCNCHKKACNSFITKRKMKK